MRNQLKGNEMKTWEHDGFAGFDHVIGLKEHNSGNHNYKINRKRGAVIQLVRTKAPEGSDAKLGVYGYLLFNTFNEAYQAMNGIKNPIMSEINTK